MIINDIHQLKCISNGHKTIFFIGEYHHTAKSFDIDQFIALFEQKKTIIYIESGIRFLYLDSPLENIIFSNNTTLTLLERKYGQCIRKIKCGDNLQFIDIDYRTRSFFSNYNMYYTRNIFYQRYKLDNDREQLLRFFEAFTKELFSAHCLQAHHLLVTYIGDPMTLEQFKDLFHCSLIASLNQKIDDDYIPTVIQSIRKEQNDNNMMVLLFCLLMDCYALLNLELFLKGDSEFALVIAGNYHVEQYASYFSRHHPEYKVVIAKYENEQHQIFLDDNLLLGIINQSKNNY